ncbi:hypothetical protein HDU97_005752 [Phlyctochytrium planicorne]|nr:hypothetical protein HDU97_005752 [Phlyctochytrium planicorne]
MQTGNRSIHSPQTIASASILPPDHITTASTTTAGTAVIAHFPPSLPETTVVKVNPYDRDISIIHAMSMTGSMQSIPALVTTTPISTSTSTDYYAPPPPAPIIGHSVATSSPVMAMSMVPQASNVIYPFPHSEYSDQVRPVLTAAPTIPQTMSPEWNLAWMQFYEQQYHQAM